MSIVMADGTDGEVLRTCHVWSEMRCLGLAWDRDIRGNSHHRGNREIWLSCRLGGTASPRRAVDTAASGIAEVRAGSAELCKGWALPGVAVGTLLVAGGQAGGLAHIVT